MDIEDLIEALSADVKKLFEGEATGHDWWHVKRVEQNAIYIAEQENAQVEIVQIAALLHDVGDHKFTDEKNAPAVLITKMLKKYGVSNEFCADIIEIIDQVSYKGAMVQTEANSLEAKCVQDADRLDAMGAIGIARAFAFGGNRNRLIYEPNKPPTLHNDFEAYKKIPAIR